ncbi:MAG: PIN domain-containing protein [Alphaproteobacteria bacterium]|nr:PIN domain-containing protein [Alphaproteobacteria bacterium]
MIVVDTNVVSEVMRIAPSPSLLAWMNEQETVQLYLTSVSVAEICYGLRVLPEGRRRRNLEGRFEQFIQGAFESRILGFDEAAARIYADIMGYKRDIGRRMSIPDGQIAAIARANGFGIATRNTRDFEDCGLVLVNPFE